MWILHCTVRSSHVNLWLDRPWVSQSSNGTFFNICNFSQFQKEAIYFQQIVLQNRLISNLIPSLYTIQCVKKKVEMSDRETQGGNSKAISDNLLMYGIHIFSWIDTTGVWLEARGSRQKMLLSYRKSIKHCVSPATECFSPYSPLFSF